MNDLYTDGIFMSEDFSLREVISEFVDSSTSDYENSLNSGDVDSDEIILDHLQKIAAFPELSQFEPVDSSPVLSSSRAIAWLELYSHARPSSLDDVRLVLDVGHSISSADPAKHIASLTFSYDRKISSNALYLLTACQTFVETEVTTQAATRYLVSAYRQEVRKVFVPSDHLLGFWLNGIREYSTFHAQIRTEQPERQVLSDSDLQDTATLKKAFHIKLKRILSQIAYRQQSGIEEKKPVADSERFLMHIQIAVLDKFPIIPYDTGDFLKSLHSEFAKFLREGGKIEGNWGAMRATGEGIFMDLTPPPERRENDETASMIE